MAYLTRGRWTTDARSGHATRMLRVYSRRGELLHEATEPMYQSPEVAREMMRIVHEHDAGGARRARVLEALRRNGAGEQA